MERLTRRELLKVGAQVAALAVLPRPLLVDLGGPHPVPIPPITDPDIKDLAARALEASRAAGAQYADVRLTHTYFSHPSGFYDPQSLTPGGGIDTPPWGVDEEQMHVGVRVLVNGCWGFVSSGFWSRDEMARLGQAAVQLAKINALGLSRPMELAPTPVVADGHWEMPVKLDPFKIDPGLIHDVFQSLGKYIDLYRWRRPVQGVRRGGGVQFMKQEKAFASTDGSYCTQRLYRSEGNFWIRPVIDPKSQLGSLDFLSPAGVGFELFRDHDLRAAVLQLCEALDEDMQIADEPLEVGRYDTVLDARAVAGLLDATLGRATELDRALGYEANATGTSYLNDPVSMLGQYPVGAPALTVTANRSEPGGAATVQWDDEGVAPETFPLVKEGVLTDFHTMRESASWLKDAYGRQGRPVRSHGCAAAPTASEAPLVHPPNLTLAPGSEAQDFDSLVGTLQRGIALKSWGLKGKVDVDFQCLNGLNQGWQFYRVQNGRCVARLPRTVAQLFRAPDLWKGLLALGGAESMRRYGFISSKGEPAQATCRSVTAPPAVFKQLTLIDVERKP